MCVCARAFLRCRIQRKDCRWETRKCDRIMWEDDSLAGGLEQVRGICLRMRGLKGIDAKQVKGFLLGGVSVITALLRGQATWGTASSADLSWNLKG